MQRCLSLRRVITREAHQRAAPRPPIRHWHHQELRAYFMPLLNPGLFVCVVITVADLIAVLLQCAVIGTVSSAARVISGFTFCLPGMSDIIFFSALNNDKSGYTSYDSILKKPLCNALKLRVHFPVNIVESPAKLIDLHKNRTCHNTFWEDWEEMS